MFVAESRLPDGHVLEAFARWRASCRRPAASSRRTGRTSSPTRRPCAVGLAKGKYDAYLLMPRGVRDEEFHTAVCELLSDWGSTVATPEVETVRIVSPAPTRSPPPSATSSTGWGCRTAPTPPTASRAGPCSRRRARATRRSRSWRPSTARCPQATSVRDVAIRVFGTPTDIDLDAVVDVAVVGAGPAGLAGGGLRLVGGALDRRPRVRGGRRAGRHVVDDPQLPRLPPRHLRDAAGAARPQPGDPLRHPLLHRVVGDGARARTTASRTSCAPTAATSGPVPSWCPPGSPTASWACRRSRRSWASASSTAAR